MRKNWTNNNAESINNILKVAVDWKPQGARELIEKIYSVTELHFLDYRSALHDDGNYRLTKANSQYRVADALWRCKSEAQKKELFLILLKDSKTRKKKYTVHKWEVLCCGKSTDKGHKGRSIQTAKK